METQYRHAMVLSSISKVGNKTYKNLIDHFGTPEAVLQMSFKALQSHALTQHIADNIKAEAEVLMTQVMQDSPRYARAGISIMPYGSSNYPYRLKQIDDPPAVLYASGPFDLNRKKMLAIVGTRKASPYGKKFVSQLVAQLSAYDDIVIVSGLAYGIDICAHQVALAHQLSTVAVLATGLDTIYPAVHQKEATAISKQGSLLTEHPLGVQVEKYCFPLRNRIIAGLVDAVVVVEAGEKSGALITAKYANAFNRETFALPGRVDSTHAKGCHYLIKTHQAHLITSAEDLAYIMHWRAPGDIPKSMVSKKGLTSEEVALVDALSGEACMKIGALSTKAQLAVKRTLTVVTQLELKGLVSILPGGKYTLK